MEEHWEEGGANEGDAAQVWRESGRGKSSGNRAGLIKHTRQVCRENKKSRKENKTNKVLENTQNTRKMIKITRRPLFLFRETPEVKRELF